MINANNIVAAPQVVGFDALLATWRQSHFGDSDTLVKLLTTPSITREELLRSFSGDIVCNASGSIFTETITLSS